MTDTLLIELRTEELPPKALSRLGEAFAGQIVKGLSERKLVAEGGDYRWFATPRRLAVQIPAVLATAADQVIEDKLMPLSVALDAEGKPTQVLLKKLEAKGIPASEVPNFEQRGEGKAAALYARVNVAGAKLAEVLSGVIQDSVKKLPIPKVMRWGAETHQFVRPAHGLICLHGTQIVPAEVLGLSAGNTTLGHRFLSSGEITVTSADDYVAPLKAQGKVVACYAERKENIRLQLAAKAEELNATINPADGLLDEVTALVEWPVVYVGTFEEEFLEVPQECLILTMQQNQKYFPLLNAEGKLLNRFLIVSNMATDDPTNIVDGNARVVRPRLSDARFFFQQDRKHRLDTRIERLGAVVYHNKLGSQLERINRLKTLAGHIARRLHADVAQAERAAWLAKADLTTEMVGEFPELQGIMGEYYARFDGEAEAVAVAVNAHYRPRFAGDELPQGNTACAVSLADKLDALVGFFGIGQLPTGDKDPFGLRRAALGVLRMLMETPLPLDVVDLIQDAVSGFKPGVLTQEVVAPLHDFMLERLRGLLRDSGFEAAQVDAVLASKPGRLDRVLARLQAVVAFVQLPEAAALAAANKRIVNILKKAETEVGEADVALLQEPAEKALFARVNELAPGIRSQLSNEDYTGALMTLAGLRSEVDAFFDGVMVMAEEPLTRQNRLALLNQLAGLMNGVADISRLSV